jgi:hypothetical protein
LRAHPALDRPAAEALARRLFPGETLEAIDGDGSLSMTCPPDDEVHVGCFPGVSVVAAREFGIDRPSRLPRRFLEGVPGATVYLHAMHSVVDWFAYASWANGTLRRSLSVSPDGGILEDLGEREPFEAPYWAGERPAVDPEEEEEPYPLPFHPLELGEAALLSLFGYQLEGEVTPDALDPERIPLLRFKRRKSRWRFW